MLIHNIKQKKKYEYAVSIIVISLLWILELPRLLEEVELEALIPEAYTFIYNLQNFLIDIT